MAEWFPFFIYWLAFVGAYIQARDEAKESFVNSLLQALVWPVAIGAMAVKFFNAPDDLTEVR